MKIITGYTGTQHITAADDAELIRGIFGDGEYVLPTGNQLEATIVSNTEIRIADGGLVMQGRHARIDSGYETVVIENGTQGAYRNDLIVARYTKDAITSIESISLVVIKGTAASTATDPTYNTGSIEDGETRDFPLYRVRINGITINAVESMFTPSDNFLSAIGGVGIKKIWEEDLNTCGTKTFDDVYDPRTDTYQFAMVVFKTRGSTADKHIAFSVIGGTGKATIVENVDSTTEEIVCRQREFRLSSTGFLVFKHCYSRTSGEPTVATDNYLVPEAVYGIKI